MKKSFLLHLFILIVCLTGAAYSQLPKYLYGIISFYSDDYIGKTTASGETYDPDQLTAAHQTLPFGTVIEVENLENGKKVNVRVIDRGPFSAGRILDVSRKAADQLGFSRKGTVYAKITLVKIGDNKVKETAAQSSSSSKSVTAPVDNNAGTESSVSPQATKTTATPVVSVESGSVSSVPASVQTKVNTITRTNTATLYQTNQVELTNYNDMTRTNVVDIPPYEEKYIEQPVESRKTTETPLPKDDFILDEPADNFVVDNGVKNNLKNAVETNVRAPEPELPIPDEKTAVSPEHSIEKNETDNETTELVPDTLLPNEEALSVEKNESQGEALKESGGIAGGRFVVQAGAFKSESRALKFYESLRSKGFKVFTAEAKIKGKKWYRVRIGYYDQVAPAKADIERLRNNKIKATLVKVKK